MEAYCQFQRNLFRKNGKNTLIISVRLVVITFQLPFTTHL